MANETENDAPKRSRGRPRGSVNRRSQMARDIVARLNCDPLEGLLRIAKNRRLAIELRLDAMKAAVPFVHARLSTTFVSARVESDVRITRQLQEIATADPELAQAMQTLSLALESAHRKAKVIDAKPRALLEPASVAVEEEPS